MGSLYLTNMADILRAAKLNVFEVGSCSGGKIYEGPQWKQRSRSSGGYNSGYPAAIINHHTASSASPYQDVSYICFNADVKPIANLFIDRTGTVYCCAGGAANHAGSGGPLGPIPQDGMNSRSIGIEHANNGTGEVWSTVLQDVSIRVNAALCKAYNIPVNQCWEHFEWAPDRKIDRAGQSRYATGKNKWNANQFRNDVAIYATTPPPDGDDMPDEATFKQWVRDVLNEAAVQGSDGTFKNSQQIQFDNLNKTYNQVRVVEDKVDQLG